MPNAAELREKINHSRDDILNACAQAKDRAALGKANEEKAKTIVAELKKYEDGRDVLKECTNAIVSVYKNIERYAVDRKELSMEMLKIAIEKAGYIVPDASTKGIHLKTFEKTAKVVNVNGQDINLREGSAYRTVMGMLIRYTLLKAQPDGIQAIFLDEAFGTLSDTTTTTMREYFDIFKEDVLIIGIEQRDILFQGLDKTIYRAIKTGKVSDVMLEV